MRRFQFRLSTIMDAVALVAILLGCVVAWQARIVTPYRASDGVVRSVMEARQASRGVSSVDPATVVEIAMVLLVAKVLWKRADGTTRAV